MKLLYEMYCFLKIGVLVFDNPKKLNLFVLLYFVGFDF